MRLSALPLSPEYDQACREAPYRSSDGQEQTQILKASQSRPKIEFGEFGLLSSLESLYRQIGLKAAAFSSLNGRSRSRTRRPQFYRR